MNELEATWRRWYPVARQKAFRMLGCLAEADDVAQETFVRFWRAGLAGAEPRRAWAWLYRTCTRLSIDRLRTRTPHPAVETTADGDHSANLADDVLGLRQELLRIASSVPAAELEVAILHRVYRLDQAEIAVVAGISIRTIRRLLRRLDERLSRLRRDYGP